LPLLQQPEQPEQPQQPLQEPHAGASPAPAIAIINTTLYIAKILQNGN
jgi:hypothetical protein